MNLIGTLHRRGSERARPRRAASTPTFLQMEAVECGAASLGSVLAYYGRWVTLEELRVACGISRDGSRASNLVRAARRYGLKAQGYKLEPSGLRELAPPLILHWNFNHFLVFEGFLGRNRVRVNDPSTGPRVISEQELDESLTGVALAFEPGPDFRPAGEPPRLLRALRRRLEGARGGLLFVLLATLSLLIPGLVVPVFSRFFVDHVLLGGGTGLLAPLLTLMVGTALVIGTLTWLQQHHLLRLETKMALASASRFFWHVLRLPIEFFSQRFTGDISHRVDLNDRVAQLLSRELAAHTLGAGLIVFYAAVMFQYDAVLTVTGITVVSLNMAALRWVSRKRVDGSRRLLLEQAKLTGTGLGGLQTIETLKATGSESDLFARWAGHQAKVVNIRQDLERLTLVLEAVPPFLTAINNTFVLGLGGLRVINSQMTLGELVAFQVLMASFVAPVNRLVILGSKLQAAQGDMARLDDVLKHETAIPADIDETAPTADNTIPAKLSGQLELDRVSFGYSRLEAPLIEDLSLVLSPGSRIALVGRTGSGKSTIARLVAGMYEPWSGAIRFDGRERHGIPRSVLTNSIAVVDQEIFVFEGSVLDNLTLWDRTIPMSHVIAAAKDACIHDDIIARVGAYDSPIAEGGSNWSGGQLQRLEIARALTGNPSLVVLDEATSALDPETEYRIDQNLRRRGGACLIIAHRLSTIRDADEILVLDNGKVVQRGPHESLIRSGGPYADLIASE